MISSSLSIKILGCTFVVGVTIGIPLIVQSENAKKAERKEEIHKPINITKFLANLSSNTSDVLSSVISSGETFSDKKIQKWKPTTEDKKAIATKWSKAIEKMPNSFFKKFNGENWASQSRAGVCYITTYGTNVDDGQISIKIPALKSQLQAIKGRSTSARAKGESMETNLGTFFADTKHKNYKQKLQKIIDENKGQVKEKTASDLLFLHTLYEDTISRLVELGNIEKTTESTSLLWDFECS